MLISGAADLTIQMVNNKGSFSERLQKINGVSTLSNLILEHPLSASATGSVLNISYNTLNYGGINQLSDPNLVKSIILNSATSLGGEGYLKESILGISAGQVDQIANFESKKSILMKLTRYQIISISIGLILVYAIFIWSVLDKRQLIKDHKMSIAKISDCSYGGRGNAATITFIFNFYVDNKSIGGSSSLNSSELNFEDAKSFLLGRTFPVIYNPGNPKNNLILIRPKDFGKFNYSFPDSLKWILKYLHSK